VLLRVVLAGEHSGEKIGKIVGENDDFLVIFIEGGTNCLNTGGEIRWFLYHSDGSAIS
jgi:hypothetical protein